MFTIILLSTGTYSLRIGDKQVKPIMMANNETIISIKQQ